MKCRSGAVEAIVRHAKETSPRECCGLLIGRGGEIVEAVPVDNIATSATRYLLDPAQHIARRRQARARGLDVLGFYHSHPHTPPQPSPADIADASYTGHLYLIVGLNGDRADLRLFTWDGCRFEETPWEPS